MCWILWPCKNLPPCPLQRGPNGIEYCNNLFSQYIKPHFDISFGMTLALHSLHYSRGRLLIDVFTVILFWGNSWVYACAFEISVTLHCSDTWNPPYTGPCEPGAHAVLQSAGKHTWRCSLLCRNDSSFWDGLRGHSRKPFLCNSFCSSVFY